MTPLEQEFENEMLRPLPGETTASKFIRDRVSELGGVGTAKMLLRGSTPQKGLQWLARQGLLEFSMEALVIQPKYAALFTLAEIATARKRLQAVGYKFTTDKSVSPYTPPNNQELAARIQNGENETVEFKVAAAWNSHTGKRDNAMKENILQTFAAFRNSFIGGDIIVGVDDKTKTIVGLQGDYDTFDPKRGERDSFERWIRNVIASAFGGDAPAYYDLSFHELDSKEILCIHVRPASKPVFLDGDLYIRDGNGKRKLKAAEVEDYRKHRWGN